MTGPHRYATRTDTAPDVDVDPDVWMADAACAGHDPDMWFPTSTPGIPLPVRSALAVCDGCPVRDLCRRYAIRHGITQGIWGGLTERQLQHLATAAARHARRNAA